MSRLAKAAVSLQICLVSTLNPGCVVEAGEDWSIDRIEWSASLAAVLEATIENPCGDVRIRPAEDDRIVLSGVSQRNRANHWRPRVQEAGGSEGVEIEVLCGADDGSGPVEAEGSRALRRVDVTVFVPEHVSLVVQTKKGSIEVKGLRRPLRLRSEEGDLAADTEASIDGFTVSGSIRARFRRFQSRAASRLETVTGDITVLVPSTAALSVTMQSGGSLKADFALEFEEAGGNGLQTGRVVLGNGAAELFLHSEQGNLALRRADG